MSGSDAQFGGTSQPSRSTRRVLLVGWAGAEWGILQPLVAAGRMPNLGSIVATGVHGTLFARPPLLAPSVWTTIATGKRPHRHGIVGHAVPRADGRGTKPVGPATRQCKAIWNILSQQGMRSHVIGWPATHPPERIDGVMVSDRHARLLAGTGESPDDLPTVYPPEVAAKLAPLHLHARDVDFASLQQLVPRAAEVDQRSDSRLATCAAILAETATVHAAATAVIEGQQPWDFAAVCYRGIEQFSRAFMRYHPPKREGISVGDFEVYGEVVANAYAFHDLMLGRLLELAGPGTTVLVVSDPGSHHDAHHRPPDRTDAGSPDVRAGAWRHGRGIVVAAGPGVRRGGGELSGTSVADVTPTVLALLGLPRGLDMDGRPWRDALEQDVGAAGDEVFSWDQIPGDAGQVDGQIDAVDSTERASDASVRHLLDLGYTEPPDPDEQRAAERVARDNAVNLARAFIDARQPARAVEVLTPWAAREPAAPHVLDALAEAHFRAGNHAEARRLIDAILARGGDAPLAHLALGALELDTGQPAAALEHLATAERQSNALPGLHATVGRVYARMRKWPDAERGYRRALEHDPDDPDALGGLAAACLAQGRPDEAAGHARRAVAVAPDNARSHYRLGLALLALGRVPEAADALRASVDADPDLLGAHRRLAELYAGPLHDPRQRRQHESRVDEILLMRRARGGRDESED